MERFQMTRLTKSIGAACLLALGSNAQANIQAFSPSAYAEAALNLFNFTLLAGNTVTGGDGAGRSGLPLNIDILNPVNPDILTNNVDSNAGSTSDLNGGGVDSNNVTGQPAGAAIAIYTSEGAGYVPNQHFNLNTLNTGKTYVGGTSSTYGNALVPVPTAFPPAVVAPGSDPFQAASACAPTNIGDCIFVQSIVNLSQNATGSGQSDQGLGVAITMLPMTSQWFEIAFDAQAFLRAAIGQEGLGNAADSNIAWSAKLVNDSTGDTVFEWSPNGIAGDSLLDPDGVGCLNTDFSGTGQDCYEYADGFNLSRSASRLTLAGAAAGDQRIYFNRTGRFELEAFLVEETQYTFSIDHSTSANASVSVPEPTSLALAGLGLAAAGAARRRKAKTVA
jgi:hypothetical protein